MPLDLGTDVAVVGAGTMGSGIAQVAALAGHRVVVIDRNAAALDGARKRIAEALAGLVRKATITGARAAEVTSRIQWTGEIKAAAPCGLVIEAVVERLDLKRALFAAIEEVVAADAVLATNTSSLSVSAIAAGMRGAERAVGLHFFNPVPAMKLVEVVAPPTTDPKVAQAATLLMRAWGKHPVRVADVPGFIVNRVARPYYAEAFAALGEGLLAALVDGAITGAGGFRMGPLALADLIGQDVNYAVAESILEAYGGATRFRLQVSQAALVKAGRLGRKTGAGVYEYPLAQPPPAARGETRRASLADLARGGDQGLVANGVRIAFADGRPLAARTDVDVLIDAVRDPDRASALVFTARNEAAAKAACAFIEVGGRQPLPIRDRPGMLVLRTLAQLANAAADAVEDGVADAQGVDEAMMFGANHPEGPLAWARRIGHGRVAGVLDAIAAATGDDLYRPSPYFTRPGQV